MSKNKTIEISGVAPILVITFIILKLTGVIDWSWWWVLAPFWIGAGFTIAVLLILAVIAVFATIITIITE